MSESEGWGERREREIYIEREERERDERNKLEIKLFSNIRKIFGRIYCFVKYTIFNINCLNDLE